MNVKGFLKDTLKIALTVSTPLRHYMSYRFYSKQFRHYLKMRGFDNKKAEGEDEYRLKWSQLSERVEPYSYRFFRHFNGNNPNIVPEDIGHNIIEEILNPIEYRKVYSDKNLYPEIVGKEFVAKTIVCRINGSCLLDAYYQMIEPKRLDEILGRYRSLILKPTVESNSGKNIKKFVKKGDKFVGIGNEEILSESYLLNYGDDFCLQEAVEQSDFMNMLCPTSVNTLRLCVYNSVVDNKPHLTAAIVRIGRNGSYLDNAHAGGVFVGIDINTGKLGTQAFDQYGNIEKSWNGVDFENQDYIVPQWEQIRLFAEFVGSRIHHHRLIALDVALDNNCQPILIEYNIEEFSYWLFMYTNQNVFDTFTDEVIEYCKAVKDK